MDSKGEVLLTIMASLAQQESESLSANVRMGIQFRNQQGKVQINHNWFLGYTKDADGNLIIDPAQAEIVRRIYREYLEGASFLQIKRSLEADGIKNGAGHKKWYESNIQQILTNEKYIGDAKSQRIAKQHQHTFDYMTLLGGQHQGRTEECAHTRCPAQGKYYAKEHSGEEPHLTTV